MSDDTERTARYSDPITKRGGLVGRGAVLYDTREPHARPCCARPESRCLAHVVGVYEETSTGEVYYKVADGTWTTEEWIHGDDLLAIFEPAGWSVTGVKPTYLLTREHGVEDHHDLMTDGGTQEIRRDEVSRLESDEGYPIYLHNVGGKEPDGTPTRLGKWTFGTKMVRDIVLDHVGGRVLNACAGKTKLQKRGTTFVRNDIDEDRDADLHVDVREIHQHFESESFDAAVLDPPFDPGRAAKLYEGWHGQEYSNARDAVGELVRPGGVVVELGWNSWSLSDKDGWEAVEHHLFRQSSFKGDVHLTVDRKVNQRTLIQADGGCNDRSLSTDTDQTEGESE
jgi:hypothetical protein